MLAFSGSAENLTRLNKVFVVQIYGHAAAITGSRRFDFLFGQLIPAARVGPYQ